MRSGEASYLSPDALVRNFAIREFMRRWWPGKLLSDDLFAATLNAARIEREVMVQMILPLVPKLRD